MQQPIRIVPHARWHMQAWLRSVDTAIRRTAVVHFRSDYALISQSIGLLVKLCWRVVPTLP